MIKIKFINPDYAIGIMKLKPLGERVVLKPIEPMEKTKSGIYLPKSSDDRKQGEVVDVGEMKEGRPIPLQRGDKVLYGGYSTEEFEVDGQKHLIVDYKDILARIEGE